MDLLDQNIQRILVKSTSWVGDAILTTPALAALKRNFPESDLTVLAREWVAPVFSEHPAVDRIMIQDSAGRHKGIGGFLKMVGDVRAERFDLAVLFQYAFGAGLLVRLAGIPERLGHATDGRRFLLTRPIALRPRDKRMHLVDLYLNLLKRAGLEPFRSDPVFYLSPENESRAEKRLRSLGLDQSFLLGLAPGAAFGSAKQWPGERFAEAANQITARTGGAVLIFGSQGEREVAARVKDLVAAPAIDLAGSTGLPEAAALIKRCNLFLTNDSGLMHVAAAVGTPLAAVFGSTDPVTTGPAARKARIIRRVVDCAPCLKRECDRPDHPCMNRIEPGEVAIEALSLLDPEEVSIDRGP